MIWIRLVTVHPFEDNLLTINEELPFSPKRHLTEAHLLALNTNHLTCGVLYRNPTSAHIISFFYSYFHSFRCYN